MSLRDLLHAAIRTLINDDLVRHGAAPAAVVEEVSEWMTRRCRPGDCGCYEGTCLCTVVQYWDGEGDPHQWVYRGGPLALIGDALDDDGDEAPEAEGARDRPCPVMAPSASPGSS